MVLSAAVDVNTSIPQALVNTGIGMGTVFIVLILISFIIYLLGFIPKILYHSEKKPNEAEKKMAKTESAAETAQAASPVVEAETMTDDSQLVAVIAAAIAAQMEEDTGVPVSVDGLMIRSIKKRTFSY